MNEAFKPEVAERAAPAIPRAARARNDARAVAAAAEARRLFGPARAARRAGRRGGVRLAEVRKTPAPRRRTRASSPSGPRRRRRPCASRPVTLGDMPITIDALGTVTPFETVTIRTQIAGKLHGAGLQRRPDGQEGRLPRPDRSAALPGRARPGAGATGQGPGAARPGAERSRPLRDAEQAGFDLQAAGRRPAGAGRPGQGGDRRPTRRRCRPPSSISTIPTSSRRSPAAPACGWSIPATICSRPTRPASSSSPRSIRSASSSRRRRTICRASPARLNSGAKLPVTVFDRANVNELATGTLTTYDSQVDVTTGTIKMRATFDNPNGVLFPQQFVNVRLLVDTLKGVALAPNAAIQIGPSGNFVYAAQRRRRSRSATSSPARPTASGRRSRRASRRATRSSSTASTGCATARR